jgi:hypothetical protein
LSSARAVRCTLQWGNERNPRSVLYFTGDCLRKKEEGVDDAKSACLLRPGLHTCYNGRYRGSPSRETELIPKNLPQFGLKSAIRLHEAGIASKRVSAMAR